MNDLAGKIKRRLLLWRNRLRYEVAGGMSRAQVATRFVPGMMWRDDRDLLSRIVEAMPETPVRTAGAGTTDRVRLLGRDVPFPDDWHVDPFFDVRWPRRYAGAISDLHAGSDVTLLWEMNRMLFMPDIAAAYRSTGDETHARRCFELMASWADQNRYMVGKHWRSPMEAGIRLVVWTQTLSMLRDAPLPDARECGVIIRSILRQAEFLSHHFSHRHPPNNHLIGEAATLFTFAIYWPQLRQAVAWRERAEAVLEEEAARQVLADGIQYEIALSYHLFVLDFFLLYCHAKALAGEEPARGVQDAVTAMINAVLRVVAPTGRIPRVGDDSVDDFLVLRPLAAIEDQRFDDAIGFAGFVRDEYRGLFNRTSWGERLLALTAPVASDARFGEAGIAVLRSADRHLVVTAGPQHERVFPHGHMHSDAGSFELIHGSTPFVIDKGTYLYTYDAALRDHFRSSVAHNTVVIDGVEPMKTEETFSWQSIETGRLGPLVDGDGARYTTVSRALRDREGLSITHTRVFAVAGSVVAVFDFLQPEIARSSASAAWRFHVPFRIDRLTVDDGGIVVEDNQGVAHALSILMANAATEVVGGGDVAGAMFSRWYGELSEGSLVRVDRTVDEGVAAAFVFHEPAVRVDVIRRDAAEIHLRVVDRDGPQALTCWLDPPRASRRPL